MGQQYEADRKCYGEQVANMLRSCYDEVSDLPGVSGASDVSLACCEEVGDNSWRQVTDSSRGSHTKKLLSLNNLAL